VRARSLGLDVERGVGLVPMIVAMLELSLPSGPQRPPRAVTAEFARAVELFNAHDDTGEAMDEAEQEPGSPACAALP
jgi:hypothetical protein